MGQSYQHIKNFVESMGVDLRTGDLQRQYPFATASQNTMHTPEGGLSTRYGSQIRTSVYGKFGITRFATTNMLGVSKTEIIGFGADTIANSAIPYRLVKSSFTIDSSLASAVTVSMYYSEADSQFKFVITDGTTDYVSELLGLGTESSPYMLSDLETVVNATALFTMSTPTNASTTPAAFMDIIPDTSLIYALPSAPITVYYYYWEAINAPNGTGSTSATLRNAALEIGGDDYVNVSAVTLGNVLYISSGSNKNESFAGGSSFPNAKLCKYDGQSFYRAGMPNISQNVSFTDVVSASYTDAKGTFSRSTFSYQSQNYILTFKYVDKAGNIIEGDVDRGNFAPTLPGDASEVIKVTIPGGTTLSGFNTDFAVSSSAQTSKLTINVDDGAGGSHTLKVGDIAYFWDANQSRFIQREVTAVTSSSITISTKSLDSNTLSPNYDAGGNVTVKDNAAFSCNVRIAVWRTKSGDSNYYLIEEIPFCSIYTNYYDSSADTALGAQYLQPQWIPGLPPQGRFLCSFNDQLIISGNDLKPNTVYFSDQSPEIFPDGTFEFDLTLPVTGIRQNGPVLACGSNSTLDVVDGDLRNFNFVVTRVSSSIGVTAHDSMQEAEEGVLFFQSSKGPYQLVGGRSLSPLGPSPSSNGVPVSRLQPFYTQKYAVDAIQPNFRRSTAAIAKDLNLYFLFVPFEDPAKPGFATSDSVLWVYDYSRDSWRKWTGINAAGGMIELDGTIYFSSRTHDGMSGVDFDNVVTRFSQQQNDKGKYNYADHDAYIDVKHQSHWEALGEPSIYKKFISLNILSLEDRDAASTEFSVKTYLDYDDTKISVNDTLTFTTEKERAMKLKPEKARSMMLSLESQAYYEPLLISGIELEAAAPFRPVFKK